MKRILVVDDEPDVLKVVVYRLVKTGYDVIIARDGQEGLNIIESAHPDLVLLDLRLPIKDGYEVCKLVKNNDVLKDIPIIFITASVQQANIIQKVQDCGADGYIIKPFDTEELLAKVESFLGKP